MDLSIKIYFFFKLIVTVQPGNELYSQNRENKKSFGATYPPKDFF